MSEAFIVRRGGGGGLSKNTVVVKVETGSTVGLYSDQAFATKVRDFKEAGTSGAYFVTGLDATTYYIKATKGDSSTSSYVSFTQASDIKYIPLSYSYELFANGQLNPSTGAMQKVAGTDSESFDITGNVMSLAVDSYSNIGKEAYYAFSVPIDVTSYSTLNIRYNSSSATTTYTNYAEGNLGITNEINIGYTPSFSKSVRILTQADYTVETIDISQYAGLYYFMIYAKASYSTEGGSYRINIDHVWLE